MSLTKRNPQIDVCRGIAMLLVVLGHCHYSLDAPINKIILSFHMPVFFLLSGLVSKTYEESNVNLKKYVIGKIKTILLPQIMLGIITYIYDILFRVVMKGGEFGEVNILYSFWRWWFLPVLFLTELLFFFLSIKLDYKKNVSKGIVLTGAIIVSGICIYVIPFPDESPFFINVVPVAFFFYFCGFCLKGILIGKLQDSRLGIRICILLCAISVCVLTALLNTRVTMYNNDYGIIALFVISSFSGFLMVWIISGFCKNMDFLKWIGINSLYIYVWQFKAIDFMKNISEIICDKIHISSAEVMVGIAFLLSMMIIIPMVILSDNFIPFMFGKKVKHK